MRDYFMGYVVMFMGLAVQLFALTEWCRTFGGAIAGVTGCLLLYVLLDKREDERAKAQIERSFKNREVNKKLKIFFDFTAERMFKSVENSNATQLTKDQLLQLIVASLVLSVPKTSSIEREQTNDAYDRSSKLSSRRKAALYEAVSDEKRGKWKNSKKNRSRKAGRDWTLIAAQFTA